MKEESQTEATKSEAIFLDYRYHFIFFSFISFKNRLNTGDWSGEKVFFLFGCIFDLYIIRFKRVKRRLT